MSVELLYTSAERGLRQGSRGFCTVISTAGMPLNLANRLESLSGYRHLYPPGTDEAKENPVAFSHLRLSLGGRTISVISRVADYGVDYSQRTNKIAHHLVLDAAQQPVAGPAWLMMQPGLFRVDWDGQCQTPGSGPAIPSGDQQPAKCHEWQSIVGDAGWAGVLAEAALQRNTKPSWIIFSAGQSNRLLTLLNESIALLPAEQRWQVTFSTYANNVAPDIDCKVRCVLAGTSEARLATARGLVIDLTRELPSAADSPLVTLAREGAKEIVKSPSPSMAVVSPTASVSEPQNAAARLEEVATIQIDQDDEIRLKEGVVLIEPAADAYAIRLASRESRPPPLIRKSTNEVSPNSSTVTRYRVALLMLTSSAVVILAISVLALLVLRGSREQGAQVANGSQSSATDQIKPSDSGNKPSATVNGQADGRDPPQADDGFTDDSGSASPKGTGDGEEDTGEGGKVNGGGEGGPGETSDSSNQPPSSDNKTSDEASEPEPSSSDNSENKGKPIPEPEPTKGNEAKSGANPSPHSKKLKAVLQSDRLNPDSDNSGEVKFKGSLPIPDWAVLYQNWDVEKKDWSSLKRLEDYPFRPPEIKIQDLKSKEFLAEREQHVIKIEMDWPQSLDEQKTIDVEIRFFRRWEQSKELPTLIDKWNYIGDQRLEKGEGYYDLLRQSEVLSEKYQGLVSDLNSLKEKQNGLRKQEKDLEPQELRTLSELEQKNEDMKLIKCNVAIQKIREALEVLVKQISDISTMKLPEFSDPVKLRFFDEDKKKQEDWNLELCLTNGEA